MAKLAVFASGSGTNFQAIAEKLADSSHEIITLICDRSKAFAVERAKQMGIPVKLVSYKKNSREEIETELVAELKSLGTDFIVLAGYMRILTPVIIDAFPMKIVNIHPALLPKYPGTRGIEESYSSGDKELGISIHYVDYGMDSGPIITQKSFVREDETSLAEVKEQIHGLEHRWYPEVILGLLNKIDQDN